MNRCIKIDKLKDERIALYAGSSEKELLHCNEPDLGYFIAESPNVIQRALAAGYRPVSFLLEDSMRDREENRFLEDYPQVPVYYAEHEELKHMIGYQLTRGVLALMERKYMPDAMQLCRNMHRIVVLEDVVNPTNVGAVFRSAAALGAEAVLLTQNCADPLYRRASRVSMGTVFQIPWTWLKKEEKTRNSAWNSEKTEQSLAEGTCRSDWQDQLHALGYRTVAMALKENSRALDDPEFSSIDRLAVIMGTEGEGLKESTIEKCDYTVMIPMAHGVDSLNVAAASAVAFWQLCRR